ncbi:1486_t:CDS:2, partial [Funneliformis mosseae]
MELQIDNHSRVERSSPINLFTVENMFNSQRNNINGQYFSHSTELINHPNHRTTINNTESTPSTRQNSTSTNQIARLVR